MKKIGRITILIFMLSILLAGTVMAAEEEYILTKELTYENVRKSALTSGFVEVLIGSTDFVQYQDDNDIIITPLPDEIVKDDFGNLYAYFDVTGLRAGQKLKITIKRESKVTSYEEIIPTRTDTSINEENEIYLESREKIESDEPELVSKAKEITEGITTDYKKAQAIFEYININMSYDTSSAYANKGAMSALKSMRGVCEEFTTLFVAMCRAVDIPSRAIEGYKVEDDLSGDEVIAKNLINHVWAEIYLDEYGWVPVEPTVIYLVNGERRAYLNSFCRMESPEYIATGIYNYEKANRRIKNLEEIEYKETVILKDDVEQEIQNTFEDIAEYTWATEAIQNLYSKNIVQGYSEIKYGPQNSISRIEFICMLSRLLKHYDTQAAPKGMSYYYPDYDESHWSKDDYDFLMRCYQVIEEGDRASMGFNTMTSIFGTGKLNMNQAITRAEAVALMNVFLDDKYEAVNFSDISNSKFKSSIQKAYSNGLINGYPDGTFRPNNPITRAEMAVILNRYIVEKIYVL